MICQESKTQEGKRQEESERKDAERKEDVMNIEIANRLFELRKKNSLSQEELAEKVGVSRQAVSKWERAESSPDTDNLIQLAKLYGMSLDELLLMSEPAKESDAGQAGGNAAGQAWESDAGQAGENAAGQAWETGAKPAEESFVGQTDQVSIGLGGIHVSDKDGTEVHIDLTGVRVEVNDETAVDTTAFPFVPLIVVGIYLVLGFIFDLWHPGWLVFFVIPIFYEFVAMAEARGARKKANLFPMALFCVVTFLLLGFLRDLWHPTWLVFLLIPIYHSIVSAALKDR